ncbi:unnamed protein product [Linum trigynum]|uniref:Uncharacterized protein n=1 Tax=Linum trigynum TaxID=586398 RepID=A0AAV2GMQ8_9ROSI
MGEKKRFKAAHTLPLIPSPVTAISRERESEVKGKEKERKKRRGHHSVLKHSSSSRQETHPHVDPPNVVASPSTVLDSTSKKKGESEGIEGEGKEGAWALGFGRENVRNVPWSRICVWRSVDASSELHRSFVGVSTESGNFWSSTKLRKVNTVA